MGETDEDEFPADGVSVSLDALNASLQFFLSQNEGIEIAETSPTELLELIYEWEVYTGWTNESFPDWVEDLNSTDETVASVKRAVENQLKDSPDSQSL